MNTMVRSPFRPVPASGVIAVMNRAMEKGFFYGNPEWVNFGQGSPEVGPIVGSPERLTNLTLDEVSATYAPVGGIPELRQAIADLYNHLYRKGKKSQYTADNVAVSSGGRAGITRVLAAMDPVRIGHFTPDYASYELLLDVFHSFQPITIPLPADRNFAITPAELEEYIVDEELGALLISNPCNPTGQHIGNEDLAAWVQIARKRNCTCVFDEFYSHYVYGDDTPASSAAAYVEDIEKDPVLIIEGLTKNWRYPGLRLSWTVGPAHMIRAIECAGSSLDGGASHCAQTAAIPLLDPVYAKQKIDAEKTYFASKATYMTDRLNAMGIKVQSPKGGLYCWADLSSLPPPLNIAQGLFDACLEQKLITVPGEFFDINPGKRRAGLRYTEYARFCFGPPIDQIEEGLSRLECVLKGSTVSMAPAAAKDCQRGA